MRDKVKLIFVDLDGTLLDDNNNISELNKTAIARASAAGIRPILSTGRRNLVARQYAKDAGLDDIVISSSGAFISKGSQLLYENNINHRSVENLGFFCIRHNILMHMYTENEKISTLDTREKDSRELQNKTVITDRYNELIDLVSSLHSPVLRVAIIEKDREKLNSVYRYILEAYPELEIINSGKGDIEITNKGVDKGNAIKVVREYLRILPDNILSIGDSNNDLSMFRESEIGVAVSNASDIVKLAANYTAQSDNNHSIMCEIIGRIL